ncbi:hypothetical protein N431DRAFT_553742 [Stipitochalara longipes BDJ]|nr:hypothetical protein N431DRAFT_553742 [Stipitochalara longipes BDJ]
MEPDGDLEIGEHEALLPKTEVVRRDEDKVVERVQQALTEINSTAHGKLSEPDEQHSKIVADTVAVPLEMLQNIVDFCAQTLRETSETKQILHDLERSQWNSTGSNKEPTSKKPLGNLSAETSNNVFKFERAPEPFLSQDSLRGQMIAEIWDKVEPFSVESLMSNEAEDATDNSSDRLKGPEQASTSLETYLTQYPAWDKALGDDSAWHTVFIYHLKDRLKKIGKSHSQLDIVAYIWSRLGEKHPDDKLGALLKGCYEKGLFPQPKGLDASVDLKLLFAQILQVAEYSILLNDVYKLGDWDRLFTLLNWEGYLDFMIKGVVADCASVETVLGLPLSKLIQILHIASAEVHPIEGAKGNTLRIDDLDILSLTSIANYGLLASRLVEDLPETFMQSRDITGPGERMSVQGWHANTELVRSWAILFAKGDGAKKSSAMLQEHSMLSDMPDALQNYLRDKHLGDVGDLTTLYDRMAETSSNKTPISYELFPIYQNRLRELRHYMDNQKPRGLRQLWKDNRDSLNYYTFWGVIVFGGLSLLLALLSLAMSVAQAVASFRALTTSPTSTSG